MSFTRTIDDVVYLDETRLWESVSKSTVPVPTRLSEFMRQAGVRFYDEAPGGYNFVMQPQVAITGFGGFPISFDDKTPAGQIVLNKTVGSPTDLVAELNNTMGRAGFYSYMNPGNHSADKMNDVTSKHGHFSKAHTGTVDLAILGYSAAIEGNLMLQRRWFNHVGRNTNTRTLAQSSPPLVVLNADDLALAKAVRSAVSALVSSQPLPVAPPATAQPSPFSTTKDDYKEKLADHYERLNALWPNSRALILMVNADLANLRGTVPDIKDKGQELEYRRLLAMINDTLLPLFPEMFEHSSTYGYEMPSSWPGRTSWDSLKGIWNMGN